MLESRYSITGFPTVVILDYTGKAVARLGYHAGGPGPFLSQIQALGRLSRPGLRAVAPQRGLATAGRAGARGRADYFENRPSRTGVPDPSRARTPKLSL